MYMNFEVYFYNIHKMVILIRLLTSRDNILRNMCFYYFNILIHLQLLKLQLAQSLQE